MIICSKFDYVSVVIATVCLIGSVFTSTCQPFQVKKEHFNISLIGHALIELPYLSHHECAKMCLFVTVCESIDYDKRGKRCKLNDASSKSLDYDLDFEERTGATFSDISEWPSGMVGSCGLRPCLQHQMCFASGSHFTCLDMVCGTLPSISNGHLELDVKNAERFLDTASVICDNGFLASANQTMCQLIGIWKYVSCDLIVCGSLPTIANGNISLDTPAADTYMDTATVHCDNEHVADINQIKCEASGSWEIPTCEKTDCGTGWLNYGHKCYHFSNFNMSWWEARLNCLMINGNLLQHIDDYDLNAFIADNISEDYAWIGLNDIYKEGEHVWLVNGPSIESGGFNYNWTVNEPTNGTDSVDCVVINKNDGKWQGKNCFEKVNVVCEKDL